MRQELLEAIDNAHAALGETCVWWTAGDRLKILQETRAARSCALCHERKQALSPLAVTGPHDVATDLAPSAIEAIHRIVSDPGRLSESWYRRTTGAGLSDEAYVELLSVVAITTALDTFARARGTAPRNPPEAKP